MKYAVIAYALLIWVVVGFISYQRNQEVTQYESHAERITLYSPRPLLG